jgi:hypothetical protein
MYEKKLKKKTKTGKKKKEIEEMAEILYCYSGNCYGQLKMNKKNVVVIRWFKVRASF